ncbi:concanavalin A-like lectin/glucanase domain-containing protein [Melampsora americana]|nr:concanavalin A-like lectin/glucanase domain-containing protein [Melampsora americana]
MYHHQSIDPDDSVDYLISELLPFRHQSHELIQSTQSDSDTTLALLLPLLVLLSTSLFLLLLFLIFLIVIRRRRSFRRLTGHGPLRLSDSDGPLDLSQSDQFEHPEALERRWLEQCTEAVRSGYLRAKLYQTQYRPNSFPTDITLSQFLSIQEKGVSAWAFEPDYDSNPSLPLIVQSRTEITFLADGVGLSPSEGGAVCVQSNLPLPKLNEVYYFECKIYEKLDSTDISIGLATKPYPTFRLPGWNRLSIGYFASDGFKAHNYPFTATSYGPPLKQGDVLGVGYRPRTGAVFFTRNGKKLEDAFVGLQRFNVFPTIGATGPASVHVNLGQAGFVFIEANVKKWGLAPMAGTLAPPPAYGHQTGSILLSSGNEEHERRQRSTDEEEEEEGSSVGTIRPILVGDDEQLPHNPPTPRPLDISLRQIRSDRSSTPNHVASPPNYAPIDPYKYAAGVAEVMLAEQFGGSSDWRMGGAGSSSSTR